MNKSQKEKRAEYIYNIVLNDIIVPLTGNETTYLDQLEGVGDMLFHDKFVGVYPSDMIPKLTNKKKYCILNLDSTKEPGSHWIAVGKNKDETYVYDSFGRKSSKIIKALSKSGNGQIFDVDLDPEQDVLETNCGARCLAWLVVFDRWGIDYAKLI